MTKEEVLNRFAEWLDINTNLSFTSKRKYVYIAKRLLKDHDIEELKQVETLNRFVKSAPTYAKYALKHLLTFLFPDEWFAIYTKLVSKKVVRKREYRILEREKVLEAIERLRDPCFKCIAYIQFCGGARARDVIRIRKEHVFREEDGGVSIKLLTKGAGERWVYIPKPFADFIWNYVSQCDREYPFTKGRVKNLEKRFANTYLYYHRAIRKAQQEVGLKTSAPTHHLRADWITKFYLLTKDVIGTQRAVGHKKIDTTLRYIARYQSAEDYKRVVKQILGTE